MRLMETEEGETDGLTVEEGQCCCIHEWLTCALEVKISMWHYMRHNKILLY